MILYLTTTPQRLITKPRGKFFNLMLFPWNFCRQTPFHGNEWMKEHNCALQNNDTCPRLQSTTQNIYTHPFSKRFSYRERYIDTLYTFVFLHVRPCAFFTRCCPTCEKTRFNDIFFLLRVLCSNLKRTYRWVFFRKVHAPCNTNLQWRIIWLIKSRHAKNNFFLHSVSFRRNGRFRWIGRPLMP